MKYLVELLILASMSESNSLWMRLHFLKEPSTTKKKFPTKCDSCQTCLDLKILRIEICDLLIKGLGERDKK